MNAIEGLRKVIDTKLQQTRVRRLDMLNNCGDIASSYKMVEIRKGPFRKWKLQNLEQEYPRK